ncbi:MAG: hypothetical protein HY815_18315, partial [Candidatus Riflebacteria bacterium]|nr:hypothetical protein [Candidatus Riflebacteria bacterium]
MDLEEALEALARVADASSDDVHASGWLESVFAYASRLLAHHATGAKPQEAIGVGPDGVARRLRDGGSGRCAVAIAGAGLATLLLALALSRPIGRPAAPRLAPLFSSPHRVTIRTVPPIFGKIRVEVRAPDGRCLGVGQVDPSGEAVFDELPAATECRAVLRDERGKTVGHHPEGLGHGGPVRFTPTCVGTARRPSSAWRSSSVHPHVRGDSADP